ncbi:MAG: alkaline phosphatase, partial [Acidobacteria bacterium]|nr:alkaline phosphatase [Acidobacteriota bacterium]
TANFRAFNSARLNSSIRIFGPNATVAQDLEPEYIAVSDDSRRAWVTLQENNAVGVLDLRTGEFTRLIGLRFKDHSLRRNGIDSSDRINSSTPGVIEILPRPVFGMY